MRKDWATAALVTVSLGFAPSLSVAQQEPPQRAPEQPTQQQAGALPEYKPPLRGAPGGRVSGATRGTMKPVTPLPTVDLIAPDAHTGLTSSATPIFYFYVSRRVSYPTRLTISAPMQPAPVIEANIPSPQAAGIYAIRLGDYRVRLEPGIVYTWSVSIILNPRAPSRDIVASASLLRVPSDPGLETTVRAAPSVRRAALLAEAGLWYDAVGAAGEAAAFDRYAAMDALINEVGLLLAPGQTNRPSARSR
jgi:hypothetical protein